jgi:hypothetical protein
VREVALTILIGALTELECYGRCQWLRILIDWTFRSDIVNVSLDSEPAWLLCETEAREPPVSR